MKSLASLTLAAAVVVGSGGFVASAQSVISAKSGLIHFAEGRVFLGDQLVENKFGEFPDVKENQQLRTEEGRAEVLLNPGVFLRIGESSAIRMITNRLIDTRVEFLSGSILVEVDDLLKDNSVTLVYKDYTIQPQKKGLYRFDSEPAQLRVYDGEALAQLDGKHDLVKEGHLLPLDGELKLARFNKNDVDELFTWSRRRSEYISMANVSSAKTVNDYGSSWGSSSWYWNPYFNMFTYLPFQGIGYSPFGYAFWSPYTVYNAFYGVPGYYGYYGGYYPGFYGGGGGTGHVSRGVGSSTIAHNAVGSTRSGLSGAVASSGGGGLHSVSSAASSSLSSGVSRSSGSTGGFSGGGHSGGGGGGHH